MSASVFQEVAKPVATAVILAGGHGPRLWPASLATPKNLLPAQGTPLVLAAVNEAAEARIRDRPCRSRALVWARTDSDKAPVLRDRQHLYSKE
jgi:CTP:molybdopterin cytidylyltransferase MocA